MYKTYYPKSKELSHDWVLVDAEGQTLGRLASEITRILLGKNKTTYTPGVDTGDNVIIINCEKLTVTGNKLEEKMYYRHSLYPGGLKEINLRDQLAKHPDRVIRSAVWGMLPKNKMGRKLIRKLKIYSGPDHPHAAQKPNQIILNKE